MLTKGPWALVSNNTVEKHGHDLKKSSFVCVVPRDLRGRGGAHCSSADLRVGYL